VTNLTRFIFSDAADLQGKKIRKNLLSTIRERFIPNNMLMLRAAILFFVVTYGVYAASPVFVIIPRELPGKSATGYTHALTGLRIFLVEHIFSWLDDGGDNEQPGERILVQKKKSLAGKSYDIKIYPAGLSGCELSADTERLLQRTLYSFIGAPAAPVNIRGSSGFGLISSGVSPPLS